MTIIWRKRPSTTAAAKKLGSRRNTTEIAPGIGVRAMTSRRPSSSPGFASSKRYGLIERLRFRRSRPPAQTLPPIDVATRTQAYSQECSERQRIGGVHSQVPHSAEDRSPTVEFPSRLETELCELIGRQLPR